MRRSKRRERPPECVDAEDRLRALNLDVKQVYIVEPAYICYRTTDDQARTARFVKGAKGPQLDGVSYGWPVL